MSTPHGEMRILSRTLRSCLVALLMVAVGCGDDGSGNDSASEPDFLDFSSLELPYETAEECIDNAQAIGQFGDGTACLCENCLGIMQECDALRGCVAIRGCGFESGCRGAFGCYLLPNAPCVEVINLFGNASAGAAILLDLNECETAAGCME